jgi:2-polyprenyl-3-methyl-5-hydroxy-6-metoxy-1,4-benzoquinol methylase
MTGEVSVEECPLCKSSRAVVVYWRTVKARAWQLRRCADCGLHFTYPRPNLDDIRGFYSQEYHQELTTHGASEVAFGAKFERYVRTIKAHFSGGRVLDIGCSTGLFPRRLRDAGFDAEGLEINPRTADWGSKHFGIRIHTGTIEEFPEREQVFDLVTMTDALEHTENPLQTLTHVNRMVRPGGGMFITFPDILAIKSRYHYLLWKVWGRDWLWSTCHIPGHTWEFTEAIAVRCFEQAGFKVIDFRRAEADGDVDNLTGKLSWLELPMLPLRLGSVARHLGTQMEFLLRKIS